MAKLADLIDVRAAALLALHRKTKGFYHSLAQDAVTDMTEGLIYAIDGKALWWPQDEAGRPRRGLGHGAAWGGCCATFALRSFTFFGS